MASRTPPEAGHLLRVARARAGLSQAELGRRSGVTQSVISAYESGARNPSLTTLVGLVAATGFELRVEIAEPPVPLQRGGPSLRALVEQHSEALKRLAARHGATNLRLFGSVARGEETSESDVDLLVDLSPDVGLFGLARLRRELSDVLGVPVDVVPASDLKPGVAAEVAEDLVPL